MTSTNTTTIKTLGILGGMGPEATSYFFQLLTKRTPASCDQDHIPVIINSATQIPDRSKGILSTEKDDIVAALQVAAKTLESAGAELIVIPCNTAHYFIEYIQDSVSIPVENMIQLTSTYCSNHLTGQKIGLVGTLATMRSGLYETLFKKSAQPLLFPDEKGQLICQNTIKALKAGALRPTLKKEFLDVVQELLNQGCQSIILGCTELPLIYSGSLPDYAIDPMVVMADHCIKFCK